MSQYKEESLQDEGCGYLLTDSQEEMLDNSNQEIFKDIPVMFKDEPEIYMNLPIAEKYGMLGEPNINEFPMETPVPPTGILPAVEDWPGPYNFEIILGSESGRSNVFSTKLGKLFVNANTQIPIEFRNKRTSEGFRMRALPLYTSAQDCVEPVMRCITHVVDEGCNQGTAPPEHVIRCRHESAQYHMDPTSGRLSVVVSMDIPQAGVDKVKLLYEFVCKSSCIGGMNRRAIAVVFTLERPSGEVVGRRHVPVRICSCPKRDKKKEEAGEAQGKRPFEKKRPLTEEAQDGSETVKMEPGPPVEDDELVYNLRIQGRKKFRQSAMFIEALRSGEARRSHRPLTTTELALQVEYDSIIDGETQAYTVQQ